MVEFAVGAILANRYRLESLLGQGGMGAVWRAHHLTLNSPVAVKLIDPRIASTGLGVERFVREARAAAALRSPHVVQTLDYGVHEGVPYIAMELMEGESLADRLNRLGTLSPSDTARFLTHMGRAVGKAHDAGIVHRDLKPDNVFLVHNDDEEVAKVLDFGIAKMTHPTMGASSQTETGVVIGTPFYMSPEQAGGSKVDHRADLWAMGVIAYQCLLGHLPFPGQALGEVIIKICTGPIPVPSQIGRVPHGFDAWFAKACARDPEQRFQSARQMTDAFRLLLTRSGADSGVIEPYSEAASAKDPPVVVPHQTDAGVTKGTPTQGGAQKTRALAIAAAVAAVALAGWGVFALVGSPADSNTPPTPSATLATSAPKSKPADPTPPATPEPKAEPTRPSASAAPSDVSVAPAGSTQPVDVEPESPKKKPPGAPPVVAKPPPVKPPPPVQPAKPGGGAPPPPAGPTDFGF